MYVNSPPTAAPNDRFLGQSPAGQPGRQTSQITALPAGQKEPFLKVIAIVAGRPLLQAPDNQAGRIDGLEQMYCRILLIYTVRKLQ